MQCTEGMFNFYVDLHRVKQRAKACGHTDAIASLQNHYPEIFEENFEKSLESFCQFVHTLKTDPKARRWLEAYLILYMGGMH
jgi:hypothetical protein